MAYAATPDRDDKKATVLFVGTPPIDLQAACKDFGIHSVDIDVVSDGRRAIRRLTDASEPTADSRLPDLILLEFGFELPDGTTILHAIKSSPRLGAIPVVVLTATERDAEMAYVNGGNAHITIPDSPEAYTDFIGSIGRFWFEWAEFSSEYLCSDR